MIFQVAREIFEKEFSKAHAQFAPRKDYYARILESSMPVRLWLRLTELAIVAALVAVIIIAWQADRHDRAQLTTQLAAAQQTIAEAAARQKDRDSALSETLAQIAAQKQAQLTASQLLKLLPQALSLPAPLTLQPSSPPPTDTTVGARYIVPSADTAPTNSPQQRKTQPPASNSSATLPNNPTPKSPNAADALIPSADLKPLYDFALDCRACQARLAAAQNDLTDERTKSAALIKQRDDAIRVAKGGSALRRIVRAAKWFALGAAAGAIAAKTAR